MISLRRLHKFLVCMVVVSMVMSIYSDSGRAAASSRVAARGLVGASSTNTRYTAKSISADTPTITNTSTKTATVTRTATKTQTSTRTQTNSPTSSVTRTGTRTNTLTKSRTPTVTATLVPGSNPWGSFTTIAAGYGTTCALNSAGNAYCWGNNGGLGNGTTTTSYIPWLLPCPLG